jgi:glycosyltransferase involved in cell wall biosynthesis
MVGDGPMLGSCIDYSKRLGIDISFKGKSKNVACELDEMDVVVVPSFKDAFNMVLVEAMARGVPTVAYATGAIPEIITNNQTGLLVPCGALRSLVRAVLRVLFDIPLYAKLSLNGFNHAGEHFNLRAYRKKWDDLALALPPRL